MEQAQLKSKPTKKGDPKAEGYGLELEFLGKGISETSVQPHVALRILPLFEIDLLKEVSKQKIKPSRIFIASEKDLKKVKKAIVVREILKLNRSKHIMGNLNEFHKGTKLVLPVIDKTRHFLLDLEVATAYHQIKYYYEILEHSLRQSFESVDQQIQNEKKAGNL